MAHFKQTQTCWLFNLSTPQFISCVLTFFASVLQLNAQSNNLIEHSDLAWPNNAIQAYVITPFISADRNIVISNEELVSNQNPRSVAFEGLASTGNIQPRKDKEFNDPGKVEKAIKKNIGKKFKNFSIHDIKQSNQLFTGKATIASVADVVFKAKLQGAGKKKDKYGLKSITFEFPDNVTAVASILDKLLKTKFNEFIPEGLPTPSLRNFEVEFDDDGKTANKVSALLACGSKDWNVLKLKHFAVNGINLSLTAEDIHKASSIISIALKGQASLDKVKMIVSGNLKHKKTSNELALKGTVKDVSIKNILHGFAGATNPEVKTIVSGLPDQFANLKLDELTVDISPTTPSVSVYTKNTLGIFEISVVSKDNKANLTLGAQAPDIMQLGNWLGLDTSSIQALKGIDVALFIATAGGKLKTSIPNFKNSKSFKLIQGLNFIGRYKLMKEHQELIGIESVSLEAKVPKEPWKLSLRAKINSNIELAELFYFRDVFFGLKLDPEDAFISFGGNMGIILDDAEKPKDKTRLNFGGQLKILPLKSELCGELLFTPINGEKVWKNPFGMPGIGIGSMGLAPCLNANFPWLTQVSIKGGLELGTTQNVIKGNCLASVDILDPTSLVINAGINELSIASFIEAFVDTESNNEFRHAKEFIESLGSKFIGEEATGIGKELVQSGLEDVYIKIATSEKTLFDSEGEGDSYTRGISFRGKTNLFGLHGEVDVAVEPDSLKFKIFGTVDPITIDPGGFPIFELKGYDQKRAKIDILISPNDIPRAEVNAEVKVLGITDKTKILLSPDTLQFHQEGNLYGGGFHAEFDVTIANYMDLQKANFHAKGELSNTIQTQLADAVLDFLDKESQVQQQLLKDAHSKNNDLFSNIYNTILDAAGTFEKGLYVAAKAIDNGLKDGFNIEKLKFESDLDANEGHADVMAKVTVLGNHIDVSTQLDFKTHDVLDLAEEIGKQIIHELGNIPSNVLTGLSELAHDFFKNYEKPTCPPGRNCVTYKNDGLIPINLYVDSEVYTLIPIGQYRQYVLPRDKESINLKIKGIPGIVPFPVGDPVIKSYNRPINQSIRTPTAGDLEIDDYLVYPNIIQRSSSIEPIFGSGESGNCLVLENKSRKPVTFKLGIGAVDTGAEYMFIPDVFPGHFRKIIFYTGFQVVEVTPVENGNVQIGPFKISSSVDVTNVSSKVYFSNETEKITFHGANQDMTTHNVLEKRPVPNPKPVCPPGRDCITFKNSGIYVAKFYVNDTEYEGVFLGEYRQHIIPDGTSQLRIGGEIEFVTGNVTIFEEDYDKTMNAEFIVKGNAIDAYYEQVGGIEPFNPNIGSDYEKLFRLDRKDKITQDRTDAGYGEGFRFSLATAEKVTWFKSIVIFDNNGRKLQEIGMEDSEHGPLMSTVFHPSQFNGKVKVEFWKAKALGVPAHVGTKFIDIKDIQGKNISFKWLND